MPEINHPPRPEDPIRDLIRRRLDELRMSDAKLSRLIGREPSYINQYFRRGSPSVFDDRTRSAVAEALGLNEALLAPGADPTPVTMSISAAARHTGLARSGRHIPAFVEGRTLEHDSIAEWVERPSFVSLAGLSFALHITQDHGRLQIGDTAFVTGGRPPRCGDLAVALSLDQRQLLAIGSVSAINAIEAQLLVDNHLTLFSRRLCHILKIAGVHYA